MKQLYKRSQRDEMRKEHGSGWFNALTSSETWQAAMAGFPDHVRYTAANLAAHNWDVTLIGDRLLISSAWSRGDWYDRDGTRTNLTSEEQDQFYPRCEEQPAGWTWNEWHARTTNQTGGRRLLALALPE